MPVTEIDIESVPVIEPAVAITDAAARQIRRALAKKADTMPNAFVRLAVKGGGCSGLSYVMEPHNIADNRDRQWMHPEGFLVVIDTRSLEFIAGSTIDYDIRNLMEGGFVWSNPKAAKTCGCGTSFTPA
jgi:iron-sulfur cluster assembly protein